MGFGPQLADLNGDGRVDVLSGSWPGEIYWFIRAEDGGWDEPQVLKTKAGAALKVGNASAIAPIDWDGDGDIDLVIGEIRGKLFLALNEGSPREPVFGEPMPLVAADKVVEVARDGGPTFADWDGDGVADLVCGDGDGAVWLFPVEHVKGGCKLAAGEKLIEGWTAEEQKKLYGDPPPVDPKGEKIVRNGMRAKVAVADWNVDGLPDLLVGDFIQTYGEEPKLSQEEIAERDRVNAEWADLEPRMREIYDALRDKVLARFEVESYGELDEKQMSQFKDLINELMDSDEEFLKFREQRAEILEAMRKFERPSFWHGWVWVYLQKPAGDVWGSGGLRQNVGGVSLEDAAKLVTPAAPTNTRPVTFAAAVSSDRVRTGEEITVVIRARVAAGWRLYTEVPADMPLVAARATLDLPDGLAPLGEWQRTASRPDRGNPAVQVVDGELIMARQVRVERDVAAGVLKITCRLDYQVCNERICLPPADETTELDLTVVSGAVVRR